MKEREEIWVATTRCPGCNKEMTQTSVKKYGINVRAWKCFDCNKLLLHPGDTERAERVAKEQK